MGTSVSPCVQAYVAVKSVAFYYAPGQTLRTVLLLATSVMCINSQSVYLRSWAGAYIRPSLSST